MPYIDPKRRPFLLKEPTTAQDPGELNFVITSYLVQNDPGHWEAGDIRGFINKYLDLSGRRYRTYNEVIGVLVCVVLEWERRKDNCYPGDIIVAVAKDLYAEEIAPYEDRKIAENGDVY